MRVLIFSSSRRSFAVHGQPPLFASDGYVKTSSSCAVRGRIRQSVRDTASGPKVLATVPLSHRSSKSIAHREALRSRDLQSFPVRVTSSVQPARHVSLLCSSLINSTSIAITLTKSSTHKPSEVIPLASAHDSIMSVPAFADLPISKSGPYLNAWGLYGVTDELGTLNRLTDDVVRRAAQEIKTGTRISLNWPLDAQGDLPFFSRQSFHKQIIHKDPRIVNDDIWTFNTQSSSQWDGLRHYGYQKEKVFYNGVTLDDIHGRNGKAKSNVNGIGAWSEQGIVGRGVLLDWHRWRLANGRAHHAFESEGISATDLKAVARAQGVDFTFGDILLVRSGYMHAYNKLPRAEIEALRQKQPHTFAGVEQSTEMLEFLWSNFSAAAGDQPSWETWPTQREWSLHEVMLGGWGMPIGELFDLEKLAAHCEKTDRYTFFVTSEPVNVPGGVASPPNILAIF